MARHYYTLVSSLPYLPPFERMRRLPINRAQLDRRLTMLSPEDAAVARTAENYLEWQRQPLDRTDRQVAEVYERLMTESNPPILREMVTSRLTLRTIMAAMRHRRLSSRPPAQVWGVGPWVKHLERHWLVPDFQLAQVYPWLPRARELFENGDALGLQRLLMTIVWERLEALAAGRHFTFDAVLTYLFKWDIAQRWLNYSTEQAAQRFQQLTDRAIAGHELFANP